MLAFVTSLRHPHNSDDYGLVEELLADTLGSVAAQTVDDFVVIVVGNQRPRFPLPPRVEFVQVDFPPPSAHHGPRTPLPGFVRDKGTKIGVGLAAARAHAPDRVMIFDADDFVHRDLARFAAHNPGPGAWVVENGYMLSRARNAYRRQPAFNRTCGTCHIVDWEVYAVPESLGVEATQDEVEAAFGERLPRILGAHREAVEWFSAHDVTVAALPFPGAIYHVDTGENHSGKQMRGLARPVGHALRTTFGLPARRLAARDVWSAVGPSAWAESARMSSARTAARVAYHARRLVPRARP